MKMKTQPTGTSFLRGKFIAMSAYIKKTERAQISDLMIHLKILKKQEQANPKTNRRREIIKIRAEINEIETKNTIQKINETKSWFFEKINKIDRPLANLTKMRRKKLKLVESRMQKGR
jgi:ATP-dependent protease ClpP protease subunit